MTDLATLGIRVESQEADVADQRLDDLAASAARAEKSVDGLAVAARRADGATSTMNVAVREQSRILNVSRNAMGLTAQEGLNLSRQMADIGVTAAMGMNPLMIAIQQGPQLFDIMQGAAIRTGATIRATMMAAAAGAYALLAPLLAVVGAAGAVAAVVGGGLALAARSANQEFGDLEKGLGLTKDQLDKVKDSSIGMGDIVVATFQEAGEALANAFDGPIKAAQRATTSFLDELTANTVKEMKAVVGAFVGAYDVIRGTWRMLPAAIADAAVSAANAAIRATEAIVNSAATGINRILQGLRALSAVNPTFAWTRAIRDIGQVDLRELGNPNAGAMNSIGAAGRDLYAAGNARGAGYVDHAGRAIFDRARDNEIANIRRQAGEGDDDGGRDGKSDEERAVERLAEYIRGLREQAATMGLSRIAAKEFEIAQRAVEAAQYGMADAVRAAGDALLEKMRIEAADLKGKADQLEMLRLEGSLIGASNRDRAIAIAQLKEAQSLRSAGVDPTSGVGLQAVNAAGLNAGVGADNQTALDRYNDSLRLSLDLARQINDQANDMAAGLAEAFGAPGRALGGLLTTMTGYRAEIEAISEEQEAMRRQGTLSAEREAMFARDRGHAEVEAYGMALNAAKGFFREGSDGYAALQAAEAAFRAFQFIMSVQAMAQQAAETGASVAGSATRGAASAAAGAARMFEALGPFGFPAVAAMIALLASFGLKSKGNGGGSGAKAVETSVATSQGLNQQADRTRTSLVAATAQQVEVRVTADRNGLHAYVAGTAEDVARPLVAEGMAATAGATHRQVMADLDKANTYSLRR